ncbi:helix-turn-helix domain-containing protein [Rothia terrae]|uniref:Helix-turn-helix transcriptional regulator n=1 Tax=Rothia terrae TaxID=396015 RepID=A0A7H2BGG2_9MICC|nr:helix-turn-helix transcriptional regulator [Rothia terrae]QNV38758.1 helix-turn-helix transcriptional regulator [Rothia terrae]
MTIPVFELRDRLAKARTTAGYTQADLADKLHITRATLNRYETGQRIAPDSIVQSIAEATGVPREWFYAQDGEQTIGTTTQRFTIEVNADGARIVD